MFDTPIGSGQMIFLVVALATACGFEFVNGFHDTANAVATVIYTKSLKPWYAVILSGTCNFLGVYLGGISVAMGILKLLPVDLLVASGSGAGLAMVLSLLIAAIMWNLGTWYFGLPASSSHTLIGAIVGVGLANSMMPGHEFGSGVNWHKVQEIGASLIVSPLFGFTAAYLLMMLAKALLKSPELHSPPAGDKPPPWWIRGLLVTTCSGVSFAHGSNDGQKGVGLIMLILIGLLPVDFAIDRNMSADKVAALLKSTDKIEMVAQNIGPKPMIAGAGAAGSTAPSDVLADLEEIRSTLSSAGTLSKVPPDRRFDLRARILRVDAKLGDIEKKTPAALPADQWKELKKQRGELRAAIDYAPSWVLVVVALSLGVGTMIGWKRIVVTVGEKIGKTHLTYSQGASAELVAMTTIGLSSQFGLPVSTTHVLSSGIAGTMMAQKSGLQGSTVRNIALAWVLTLPAATLLSGLLFLGFRYVLPDAKAPTPAVQFHPHDDEERATVVPVTEGALRLHGSNTIGSELAPALVEAFLQSKGATDVKGEKDKGGHMWVVTGTLPQEKKPVTVEIDAAGSETAFDDLASNKADLGMSSRPVTPAEVDKLKAVGAGDLLAPGNENVIGLDGVAVIVPPSNPMTQATVDVVAKLFTDPGASWAAGKPVHVYARDDRSGTYATFKGVVLGNRPLVANATRLADSAVLEESVAKDDSGVGFVGMPYVKKTHALAISDTGATAVAPTPFTVATEDYPITRRLYLYAPTPRRHRLTQDLLAFALSQEGQAVVAAKGFVELKANATEPPPCATCSPAYNAATKGSKRMSLDFRFSTGQKTLDARGLRDLDRLVSYLLTLRSGRVTLIGFSDSSGDANANVELSKSRATAVAEALRARGIAVATVEGLGPQMPVASNDTPDGRERNRRVEVWVGE